MTRSIIYIDGFNFYYGAIQGTKDKWLDLSVYFARLRSDDDIQRIYYFTAITSGPSQARQKAYLLALSTLPLVTIILGRFKKKNVRCQVGSCVHPDSKRFKVQEEKRTDVNIAVQILDDAYQDQCDTFIVVSGDSDLVPALNRVKTSFPKKKIVVYVPSRDAARGAAYELRAAAHIARDLPLNLLHLSQFPQKIHDGAGGIIEKPAEWS
jgi:6-hydroxy-3-succinoylpyridine 3-monooxygenase